MKTHRAFPLFLLVLSWTFVYLAAASPQDKGPDLRTVHGSVVDKEENPIPASIVYLLNKKTQAIRTYVANDEGQYRFSGLDPNVDYEIHAEKDNLISATRTISSFDSRRDMEMTLKLTHKKGEKQ